MKKSPHFLYLSSRYEQIAEEDFHVSKACIDPSTVDDGPTSIYVETESDEFIIANLTMRALSENLDLNFVAGEKICFRSEVLDLKIR